MGGSSGGGGQTTNTVQKSDPWAGQQDYLTYGFQQAKDAYQTQQPQYYQGNTIADQSGYTTQAQQLQAQRAVNGSPLQSSTNNMLGNTLNGGYMNSNPYLDANFNAGAESIKNNYYSAVNGVNAGATGNGRYGSGMQAFQNNQAQNTLASNLGNLYNQTYYNNYNNERSNQMTAASQAPAMINQDYTDLSKLSDVGSSVDQYGQSKIDADVNKWNYNQNLPLNMLGQYMGLVQGNYGGSTSTQTPISGQSMLGSALGLGSLGLGAYSASK